MILIMIIHCLQTKLEITSIILSGYCSDIANRYGVKVDGINKLVPNLRDKIQYVVHYH